MKKAVNSPTYPANSVLADRNRILALPEENKALSKLSFGLLVFLIGFNGLYFIPLVFPATRSGYNQFGIQRYYYFAYALILAGAFWESVSSSKTIWKQKPVWSFLAITSIGLMSLMGFIDGEPIYTLIRKIFIFSCLLLVSNIGLRKQNIKWLKFTLLAHGFFGFVFTIYQFIFAGLNSIEDIFNSTIYSFYWSANYASSFLFLTIPSFQNLYAQYIAIAAFISGNLKGLSALNRLTWILLPVQVSLLIYIYIKRRRDLEKETGTSQALRIFFSVVLTFFILFTILLSWNQIISDQLISSSLSRTTARFFVSGTVQDTILQNARLLEAKKAISLMNDIDWIFGKGFGGRWRVEAVYGNIDRDMVHISWVAYLLWGGVILVIVMAIPLIWIFRVLLSSSDSFALGCASYLVVMYLHAVLYNIATAQNHWILFSIVLGLVSNYHHDISKRLHK